MSIELTLALTAWGLFTAVVGYVCGVRDERNRNRRKKPAKKLASVGTVTVQVIPDVSKFVAAMEELADTAKRHMPK